MQYPILIHADPRDVRESSIVLIQQGHYEVKSNQADTVVGLKMSNQGYDSVKNGFRFIIHKAEKLKAIITKPGTEKFISLSLRKVE